MKTRRQTNSNRVKRDVSFWPIFFMLAFIGVSAFTFKTFAGKNYVYDVSAPKDPNVLNLATSTEEIKPYVVHLKTPIPLKGIYMSQCVVGTPSFREKLVKLIDETELNSVVIDIKDYTGKISFSTDNPKLKDVVSDKCGARDMKEFIHFLHEKNIYVIGRITVFQDPYKTSTHPELAVKKKSDGSVWKDHKGLSFIDVGARPHWEYIVELSKESYAIGFDELNYDYIRFPSDGNMKDIDFTHSRGKTKPEALREFFSYLHDQMKDTGAVISADLFGMTTTNTDDLNIGQVLEYAMPYFDYICPMVYPSHYPPNFNGWKDPNKYPYDLIKFVLDSAHDRAIATTTVIKMSGEEAIASTTPLLYEKESYSAQKIRPWLQDFDYGGDYGPEEVKAQIKATYDAGLDSWLLWAPSNIYTREALVSGQE